MSRRATTAVFVAAGLVVAVALACFVSPYASSAPDGLNRVAADEGFAGQEQAHAMADLPTAGYGLRGVHDDRLSTGLAGVLGVITVFALCSGLGALAVWGRRRRDGESAAGAVPPSVDAGPSAR